MIAHCYMQAKLIFLTWKIKILQENSPGLCSPLFFCKYLIVYPIYFENSMILCLKFSVMTMSFRVHPYSHYKVLLSSSIQNKMELKAVKVTYHFMSMVTS